jgi:ribose transport system permease protein
MREQGIIETRVDQGATRFSVGQRKTLRSLGFKQFSGIWLLALVVLVFGIWTPETFLTVDNLHTLLAEQAITVMVAVGLLIPLAAGTYDLSIGAVMGLAVVLVTNLQAIAHMSPLLSIVVTLAISAFIGAINAFIVIVLRVDSFIATLGTSSILAGLIIAVANNFQVVEGISPSFEELGQNTLFGIAYPVYFVFVLGVIVWYLLERTPSGRFLYAFGSNPEATRLAGIRTTRLVAGSLLASATIGGLAGIVLAARIGVGSLEAGPPYLLPAFAAAFLGSTQIKPGRVNVWGTFVAVALLATGVKGLQLVGLPLWVSSVFNGLALIVAVALSATRERARRSAAQ